MARYNIKSSVLTVVFYFTFYKYIHFEISIVIKTFTLYASSCNRSVRFARAGRSSHNRCFCNGAHIFFERADTFNMGRSAFSMG